MKRNKVHFYLVMFLATLSLISVGFASWVASEGMTTSTSGMIVVDDVMRYNEYITCSSGNITDFSYLGFVNENGNISTTGTLTANVTIHKEKCNEEFKDCKTLVVNLILDSDDLSLFTNSNNKIVFTASLWTLDADNKKDSLLTTSGFNSDDYKSHILEFYLENTNTQDLNLLLEYTFTIASDGFDYYSEEVYETLKDESFNFAITAKLTGVKEA